MSLDSDALFVWLYKYLNISVLRIFLVCCIANRRNEKGTKCIFVLFLS